MHALNQVDENSQGIIVNMIERHKRLLIVSYAPLLIMILIASVSFSILVASGKTSFPSWMIYVNPATLTIAWLIIKRVLPTLITDWTEGAGFNIAFFFFFLCTTISLWNL